MGICHMKVEVRDLIQKMIFKTVCLLKNLKDAQLVTSK